MKATDLAFRSESNVSSITLRAAAGRVFTFLQGGNEAPIRTLLLPFGWKAASKEGWALVAALDITSVDAPGPDPVAEAIAGCESWQSTGLVRARAALHLHFPEQCAFIFHDLTPGKGKDALYNVLRFVQRVGHLEEGELRKEHRQVDREALALLEESGITKAVIAVLDALVKAAQKVEDDRSPAGTEEDAAAKRELVLRKMHAWLTVWSDIARTAITRRDQLIRLGIAKRRPKKAMVVKPPAPAVVTLTESGEAHGV